MCRLRTKPNTQESEARLYLYHKIAPTGKSDGRPPCVARQEVVQMLKEQN